MTDDAIEPLITECPACHTRFRVTEVQLTAANGRVRCGACLNVFKGADHLVLSMDPARTPEDPDAALDALLSELSEVSAKHEPRKTEPTPVPRVVRERNVRERSVAPPRPSPSVPGGEPRVTIVRDVPRRRVRPPPPLPPALRQSVPPEPVPNDSAEALAPAAPAPRPAEPIPVMEVHEEPAEPAVVDTAAVEAEEEPQLVPTAPAPTAASEPSHVEEIVLDDSSPKPFAAVDTFPRETPKPPVDPLGLGDPPFGLEPSTPRRRRWWVLPAVFAALLVLAGQVLWFQFGTWSIDPQTRPIYEWVCKALRCDLPPMRALDAFRTKDLVVRSHPDRPGALLVDAIIVNEAPFAQPFPELELRFSAIGGNLIAARRFSPKEYLAGEAKGLSEIGARTPVHIALEIEDPGGDAVNYLITFR